MELNIEHKTTGKLFREMRPGKSAILSLLLLFFLNADAPDSFSASAADVTLAGFAFAGEFKDIKTRYPYTYRISEDLKAKDSGKKAGENFENLSFQIAKRAAAISNPAINLTPLGELVDLKQSDQALMSVLLITGETVLTERFDAYTKTFIRLRGDAMVFDYKNKQIVLSYPISVELFDVNEGGRPLSEAQITEHIKKMIFGNDGSSLFSQYVRRLSDAVIPAPGTRTLQVNRVEIAPDALGMFPQGLRSDANTLRDMLIDDFTSVLSARAKVSILPAKAGQSVGVMHLKLENSDDQIEIRPGEGDYLFDISLIRYVKQEQKTAKAQVSHLYGVLVHLDFYEPLSNEHFFDTDLKNGEIKNSPFKHVSGDDFPAYSDTLRRLFLKFSDAVKGEDTNWIGTAAADPDVAAKLQKTRKIIESTR